MASKSLCSVVHLSSLTQGHCGPDCPLLAGLDPHASLGSHHHTHVPFAEMPHPPPPSTKSWLFFTSQLEEVAPVPNRYGSLVYAYTSWSNLYPNYSYLLDAGLSPLLAWKPHVGRDSMLSPRSVAGAQWVFRKHLFPVCDTAGHIPPEHKARLTHTRLVSHTDASLNSTSPEPQCTLLLGNSQASQGPVWKPGKRERSGPRQSEPLFPGQVTSGSILYKPGNWNKMKHEPDCMTNWYHNHREKRITPGELNTRGFNRTFSVGGTLRTQKTTRKPSLSSLKLGKLSVLWLWNCFTYLVG